MAQILSVRASGKVNISAIYFGESRAVLRKFTKASTCCTSCVRAHAGSRAEHCNASICSGAAVIMQHVLSVRGLA